MASDFGGKETEEESEKLIYFTLAGFFVSKILH
jgi:hypothetical protein